MVCKKSLIGSVTSLLLCSAPTLASTDEIVWRRGWIAQSFEAEIGADLPQPTDQPIDKWLDTGDAMFSADYLFAHESKTTQIFNAGILRTGAIEFTLEGNYQLRSFIDRFVSFGQPECRMRVALDGATIIDQWGQFRDMGIGKEGRPVGTIVDKKDIPYAAKFRGTHAYQSVPFYIPKPGKYRFDIWTFCGDSSNKSAIFKLANTYGIRSWDVSKFGSPTFSKIKSEYADDRLLQDEMKLRRDRNPLKALILENHGINFDLALERIESGKVNRVTGAMIYHNAAYTPMKSIYRRSTQPKNNLVEVSDWLLTALRGNEKIVTRWYVDESPPFAQFIQDIDTHTPEQVVAERLLFIKESGKYGFEFQYSPKIESNKAFEKEESEHTTIRMYRVGAEATDGVVLVDRIFRGGNDIGESIFQWYELPKGEYVISITRDPQIIKRNRYGEAEDVDPWDNSNVLLSIKSPSAESFRYPIPMIK